MASGPVSRRAALAGTLGAASALMLAACSNEDDATGKDSNAKTSDSSSATADLSSTTGDSTAATGSTATEDADAATASLTTAGPKQIADRAVVPVLCYHQLREWEPSDSDYNRSLLICPPDTFRAHLDALVDDGYTTIDPDQYLNYLTTGASLPKKPVMLTFDDSQASQVGVGLPELQSRNMKATFFVMTVVLGNKGWMTKSDLRELDAEGMTIGAHTWDHHRVDEYSGQDWKVQLDQPRALLEDAIGKPVEHFAYPFGAWDDEALNHIVEAGYRSAYQLADRKPSTDQPLLTLRRDLAVSTWTGEALLKHLAGLNR